MSDRKQALRRHVEARHAQSWPILSGLSQADLSRPVYSHGETTWSVLQVVAHLADAERGLLGQVQRLAAGGVTVPEDFDLERWNRAAVAKRAAQPLPELLEEIESTYRETLAFIDSLEEHQLDLVGRHARGDLASVEAFLIRTAEHRARHAADIQHALDEPRHG